MARLGMSMLAAGAVAALASAGAMAGPQIGEGQVRARQRDKEARTRFGPVDPVQNLPGETNRQFAARMKLALAPSTHQTGEPG